MRVSLLHDECNYGNSMFSSKSSQMRFHSLSTKLLVSALRTVISYIFSDSKEMSKHLASSLLHSAQNMHTTGS